MNSIFEVFFEAFNSCKKKSSSLSMVEKLAVVLKA